MTRLVDRRAWWGGVATMLTAVVGCNPEPDGYDPGVRYPTRADVLVLQPPPSVPAGLAAAGKLDELVECSASAGAKLVHPGQMPDATKTALTATLDDMFGSPAVPRLTDGLSIAGLDLSAENLAAGSRVYRRNCVQCHGLTGDGRGPTGAWVYPYPRDFRQGIFKTADGGPKARVGTLLSLLRRGVPGTSMPAFDLLSDTDLRAVVAYIVHLSSRGETEFRAIRSLSDDLGDGDAAEVAALCRESASWVCGQWAAAQVSNASVSPIVAEDPTDPAYQASVGRGQELFVGAAGCAACHADYGRQEQFRFDVWGAPARVPDLTRGEYRWGKTPADFARRIRNGIPGSAMPAHPTLADDQVRDIVAFVHELPGPTRLPPDVRDRVYPNNNAPGGP